MATDVGTLTAHLTADISGLSVGLTKAANQIKGYSVKAQGYLKANAQDIRTVGRNFAIAGAAITAGLGLAVKGFGNFDQAMRKATAVSDVTEDQFVEMSKMAEASSIRLNIAAKTLAEGFYFLGSAGLNATQQMQAFNAVATLSKAAVMDMGTATEITVDTMKGFKIGFEETTRVTDILTKGVTSSNMTMAQLGDSMSYVSGIARTTNNSIEETVAMIGMMADVGIKGSMAGTSLRRALLNLAAPTSDSAKMMKELGLQIYDADGKMKPMTKIMEEFVPILQESSEETRNMALKTLFGARAITGMTELVYRGAEGLKEFTKELENSGGTAENVAKKQMATFNERMGVLGKEITQFTRSIGEQLIPILDKIIEPIKNVVKWLDNLSPTTKKMIGIFSAFVGVAALVAGGILTIGVAMAIISPAVLPLVGIVGGIILALGVLTTALIVGVEKLGGWGAAWEYVKGSMQVAWEYIKAFGSALLSWSEGIITVLTSPYVILAKTVNKIFPGIWETIKTFGQSVSDFFTQPALANALISAFNFLWTGVKKIAGWIGTLFNKLFGTVKDVSENIGNELVAGAENKVSKLKDTFGGAFEFFGSVGNAVAEYTAEVMNSAVASFTEGMNAFGIAGENSKLIWEAVAKAVENAKKKTAELTAVVITNNEEEGQSAEDLSEKKRELTEEEKEKLREYLEYRKQLSLEYSLKDLTSTEQLYADKFLKLEEYLAAELITKQEYDEQYIALAQAHADAELEIARRNWEEQHELQMGFLDSAMSGYDTLINQLTMMDAKYIRSKEIFEAMGQSAIRMLGDFIKQVIMSWVITKWLGKKAIKGNTKKATANTAEAVTKTLAAYPFPANIIPAATVGALGATQVGIIAAQKFAMGTEGFTVPSGFPNDSYPIGVQSGEEVNVYTRGQQADRTEAWKEMASEIRDLKTIMAEKEMGVEVNIEAPDTETYIRKLDYTKSRMTERGYDGKGERAVS